MGDAENGKEAGPGHSWKNGLRAAVKKLPTAAALEQPSVLMAALPGGQDSPLFIGDVEAQRGQVTCPGQNGNPAPVPTPASHTLPPWAAPRTQQVFLDQQK